MPIQIVEVQSKKELSAFIDFPHSLYAQDKNYVPELHIAQRDLLTPGKHPFHAYGKIKCFLAYRDGHIVGRIAAIHNPRYNTYHNANYGFFGFFDFIDDQDVVAQLLDKAKQYAIEHKHAYMMGPTNFSTNETAGTLVDGFDEPPKIMMTYNAKYYDQRMTAYGLRKEMDLYAYMIHTHDVSDKSLKMADLLEQRLLKNGITIRNVNTKNLDAEALKIKKVYNAAWEKNWGFVPFTDEEFDYLKNDLKLVLDKDFAFIAEHNGEPVGFAITLPNINEVLIKIKKGRLFPTGIFKLLLGKGKTKYVRILALGILEEYRQSGIAPLFFAKNIIAAKQKKILGGEASWILENNVPMVSAAENLNGKRYKTYRLYSIKI